MRHRIAVGRKMQISAELMKIVNQILNDFFDKIAQTASECREKIKKLLHQWRGYANFNPFNITC